LKQENPPPTESAEPYESYILNPGDILFVPSGIVHQVVITEPRASILFNCHI
jgi:quercetin dioxygenase-like cupin family protein